MEDIIKEIEIAINKEKMNEEFYKNSPMHEYYRGRLKSLLELKDILEKKYGKSVRVFDRKT